MPIKLSRKYPNRINSRYSKDPKAAASNIADIDVAMREPIKIMNNKLGYATLGCCEGHKNPINPYQKMIKIPCDVKPCKLKPYESYIGFYLPICLHSPLIDFLLSKNFFAAGGYIAMGKLYIANSSESNFYQRYSEGVALIYGTDGALKGDTFLVTIQVEPIEMPNSQKKWDELRDNGWETWLNLLLQFNNKQEKNEHLF
jgi:hypothetical protein